MKKNFDKALNNAQQTHPLTKKIQSMTQRKHSEEDDSGNTCCRSICI